MCGGLWLGQNNYLGYPFLKKYEFVPNFDKETIGFYLPYEEEKKDEKENTDKLSSQELIQYQIKEIKEENKAIANDIKEIRKMLDNYKDTFRDMIKMAIEEHVKIYHKKEQ